jgi:sugar phosphate isomerase/epimerase
VKLGVFTVLYQDLTFEEALDKLAGLGVEAVEIGTGNYPGSSHCDPDQLLDDAAKREAFKQAVESRGLVISALSAHGNPLHPDEELAQGFHETWRKTVRLASQLGIETVIGFSGCPGDGPTARWPNWVTCAWPDDYLRLLEWQWDERVLPYWSEEAGFAREQGVRIALELHPGFVVYNPETLLRLRDGAGPQIGANLDPSHLIWQGIEPVQGIRALARADALFHFHAKDTFVDRANVAVNGVLDTKHYGRVLERSWTFRTVGFGQGEQAWREILSALRTVGYDGVVSIEHEDSLLSLDEGLAKAVELLKRILPGEPPEGMWWA